MRPIAEQTIMITGATDGLGRALAGELAAEGATLLLHGRDDARGEQTIDEIGARSGNDRLHWLRADLASLEEVRALADRVSSTTDRLHTLVNNAGVGTVVGGDAGRLESRDGIELRLAVNYLAGYLLTRLLLPLIEGSAPARVVNVSSAGQVPIDFDDPMMEHGFEPFRAYCQSKLAQVMFTIDLADELRDRDVTVTCLHPATLMPTKMVHEGGASPMSSLEEGLRATHRLVADPALDEVSGRYFNGEQPAEPHPQARDAEARRKLRELSDRLCGLQPSSSAPSSI